jgi:predicted metalloprotease with PDZ domain
MKDAVTRNLGQKLSAVCAFILVFSQPLLAVEGSATIHYDWSREAGPDFASRVVISVPTLQDTQLTFIMPAWSPGAYTLSEYAQFVEEPAAYSADSVKLPVKKVDERSWRVSVPAASSVKFTYRVDDPRHSINFSINDSTHATVQGPSTFMYVEGRKDFPVKVRYRVDNEWELATSLMQTPEDDGFTFFAPNYDTFIDSPAEIGNLDQRSFAVRGRPVQVVTYGATGFDKDGFVKMVRQIVEYQVTLFDDVPFEKYVFLFHVGKYAAGGGGLEHLNSTNISLGLAQLKNDFGSATNVTAHEFFHLWNVKRIRPAVLGPFDYTQPACTRALWFAEGVTSYYADLSQLRSGLVDEGRFLWMQKQQIVALQRNPDRKITSVEKASLKIWERGYYHSGISYYNKGQLIGLLLDLRIRRETENRRSLDDVMRFLNGNYAKRSIGYGENELPNVVSSIAGAELSDFFERYVAGVEELPFAEYFSWAGIDFKESREEFTTIGALHVFGPRNLITAIDSKGAAAQAGIRRGDYLLEIDGRLIASQVDAAIAVASRKPGDLVDIAIERDGKRRVFQVTAAAEVRVSHALQFAEDATERQRRIRNGWLRGVTEK